MQGGFKVSVIAVAVRDPSRERASCGVFLAHCPMAAKDFAPATTAEQATSMTATNG
jgi:hypothetical protein